MKIINPYFQIFKIYFEIKMAFYQWENKLKYLLAFAIEECISQLILNWGNLQNDIRFKKN